MKGRAGCTKPQHLQVFTGPSCRAEEGRRLCRDGSTASRARATGNKFWETCAGQAITCFICSQILVGREPCDRQLRRQVASVSGAHSP